MTDRLDCLICGGTPVAKGGIGALCPSCVETMTTPVPDAR